MGKTTIVEKVFEKQSKQQMVLQLCFLEFQLRCFSENVVEFTVGAISMLEVQMCNAFGFVTLVTDMSDMFFRCFMSVLQIGLQVTKIASFRFDKLSV